ncbi:MAG TPA: ABC transporter substrate-binding protein [Candidatus Polarisedimenticolaceae bacterium]|nr:ABC transporter substrate-binding protein [Candidatus Polarisedimenticolaceae bacterium]
MRRRAAAILLGLALVGCQAQEPTPGDHIHVGVYGALTGSEATFGQSALAGVQLAVDERNAAGGVRHLPVEIVSYDDRGSTQEAGTAVTRLITEDSVVALIGEETSSMSIAGGKVAQRYGVPMISPSSTNPRVTAVGDRIFRVCFVDVFQSYVLARFAREHLKAASVAVLYDQSQAYSVGFKDAFAQAFQEMGGTVIKSQAYSRGDQDFSAQLTTIRGSRPDAVLVPGYYTDAANIAIQARRLGIDVPLPGGDGWDSAQLAAIGGDAVLHTFYSNHYSHEDPRPEVQGFISAYGKRQGGELPDSVAALAYDAARILFAAMEQARSLSGEDLAAALAATRDFPGVTGTISMDAERNARKPAVVLEMRKGPDGRILPRYVTTIEPP